MGAVWQAHDEILGREVAVKRVLGTDQPGVVARAWREARLAARLSHPHLVAVFDLVTDENDFWLVMEYVDGPSLSRMVKDHGPLPPHVAAAIIADVAAGLEEAHAAGIIHRDVKPGNILVPADGATKLGDFGIARGPDGEATMTMTDAVTGSPVYLAPEVASGSPAGPASDVWSLGATLFHMLTGRPPYEDGGNVLGVLYKIVNEPPPQTDRAAWLAPLLAGTMTHDLEARWSLAQVRAFLAAAPGRPVGPPPMARPVAAAGAEAEPVTAVLPTVPAVLPAAGPAAASEVSSPVGRAGRRPWLAVTAALAAVVALAVVGAVALSHRGSPAPRASADQSRDAGSPSASPSTSHPAAQTPPAHAGAARTATPSVDGVRSFVSTYLATAPQRPAAAFRMLTPGYQAASGGLPGYLSFWGSVSKVHSVRDVQVTLQPLRATYTYTYTRRHVGTVTETVQLALTYVAGHYLIADGSTVGG